MLGEVEETIYTVDEDDEGGDGEVRTVKKQSEMLFVRGMLLPLRIAPEVELHSLTIGLNRTQATPWCSSHLSNNQPLFKNRRGGKTHKKTVRDELDSMATTD